MILIKPYSRIVNISHLDPSEAIDDYGRTCYKSEHVEDPEVWSKFVKKLISNGHESVIEHINATVKIVCDRGVSHEIVRHRLASYSQESTRYCDYGDKNIEFITPCWYEEGSSTGSIFRAQMLQCELSYKALLDLGWTPQQARSVLPNSLKTELIMTTNIRDWRHIFSLRCDKPAHPQMREIMLPLLKDFYTVMPDFFSDLYNRFFGGTDERKETTRLA